ncbi:MAG TPA: FAD-binding oxidoreductase [Steroidobacteraceae bacterium]|nr:FAD-binding oxidoreductase [Steroidobacteraceae bacterium]
MLGPQESCRLTHPAGSHTNMMPALNDIHSRLNLCVPGLYRRPRSLRELFETLSQARRRGLSVSIAGGRHAMGGQQFLTGGCVIDMRAFNRILDFDPGTGLITVQSGITWPELMRGYLSLQAGKRHQWGIRQKQTGADSLTVGGAIAANIHGRGLNCAPFSCDVESIQVITPAGDLVTCSRGLDPDLFRMVVGGYGLFGIITAATLQLVPRQKVQRIVSLLTLPDLINGFESRIEAGYTYGDFQFSTDPKMAGFLRDGVFSCYQPIDNATPMPRDQIRLSRQDWQRLLYLGHVNKRQAFLEFSDFYLRSTGQVYWNDTHQLNIYLDDYHRALDHYLDAKVPGTEMITELYVPRYRLGQFMGAVREDLLQHDVDLIYGTIRLIKKDEDAFLKWAKDDYTCVIFNLHVDHHAQGLARARVDLRRLIDRAIDFGGSYFLTYHRYADREQLLRCYPEFPEFLRRKRAWDPEARLSSDWFQYYERLFS